MMATQNRPQIGTVACAFCGQEATVHQSKIGRGGIAASLYYRCGTTSRGCGCIQPRGPSGQEWIKANMRELAPAAPGPEPAPKTEPVAEPDVPATNDAGEYAPGEIEENRGEKPKKSWWAALVNGEE